MQDFKALIRHVVREEVDKENKVVRFVHEIYEGDDAEYPVVIHIFTGKTREEAKGYFDSHMKTDAFMAGMENDGKWEDIEGHVKKKWQ